MAAGVHSMVRPMGQTVLRPPSDIFPPPPPPEYAFLLRGPLPDHKVHVHHPRTNDILISMSAWDHEDGALHFGLVHNACAIIAGNRHDGYLSRSRDASLPRLTMNHLDLLAASSAIYFYHVPGDANYDIVSTFELWHEPSSLPFPWTWMEQDDVSDAASCAEQVENSLEEPYRSETCRLSNHSTAVELCPLLPGKTTDNDTYVHNQGLAPAVYPTSLNTVDCVYLDANLRHTFTHGSWVFFPKKPGTFVAHFLQPVADQVALYHNVITRPLRCELRALYQSFAKTIFDARPSH
ncbi:hypothetical protein KCU77_g9827, partial [Aureobasidium melanogenum]